MTKKHMFFSEKIKLEEEYLKWCEEQNKEIHGGKIDKKNFVNVITFLQSIGWGNMKELESQNAELTAKNEVLQRDIENLTWREKASMEFERLESENAALRARLDKAVEFKYKLGDIVYFFPFSEREVYQGKVIGIYLNYYSPSNPIWIRVQYDIPMIVKDAETEVWENMVFYNRQEAEARLAERKGENNEQN